jgi:twinkle protein
MSDITHIKRMLADQAQQVSEHLLPGGTKQSGEWRCGSVHGEPGQSLGVHLTGPKAGTWCDFANPDEHSGDLLDLWCAVKGVSLPKAVEQARSFLGMEAPTPDRAPRREYRRPTTPKGTTRLSESRVRDYLTEDRNLPADVLTRYKIAQQGDSIVFPFKLPNGETALIKRRKAEDGAKPAPTEADCEPVLFGWQAVSDDVRDIVLTEGEIDALSWAAYGYTALSLPFGGGGGGKQQWIENEYERMARFERIYLALDHDDNGDKAAEEIANRLGRHRCIRVQMPHKDGNECLVNGVTQAQMDAAIKQAASLDPEGLRRAGDFVDEVTRLFWPEPGEHVGYSMPYGHPGDKLLFRPGELTLWSGASGSGKSQILSDCQVDWVKQGSRFCLASLEMKPGMTLKRMVKQVVGVDRPTKEAISDAIRYVDNGLILYERVGKSGVDNLLEVFEYAKNKYGCDQFIIDSLMRLGIGSEDYEGQEKAVFKIVDWTIRNNVHVHLVAHTRKGDNQSAPATEDVKGAMEIGANAFNIVTVWRNRQREAELQNADEETQQKWSDTPGVVMNVAKQRNGDFEGKVAMWFDQDSYRYYTRADNRLLGRQYLESGSRAA